MFIRALSGFIHSGSDFGQMLAAAERADPARVTLLACAAALLAARQGPNPRMRARRRSVPARGGPGQRCGLSGDELSWC